MRHFDPWCPPRSMRIPRMRAPIAYCPRKVLVWALLLILAGVWLFGRLHHR